MKWFVAGIVVGIVLAGSAAYAQESVFNGEHFVNLMSDDLRLFHMVGFRHGSRLFFTRMTMVCPACRTA